ncbi:hypothetical protein [Microbacterium sp. 1.5R]|uniref:hypothetical protein n=1 Tax=Microbacterium sp. 1.5R TaxID=1916917 RepID=UPI0011A2F81D|nr:hypothetical protein [Microbacterium sp. 1.5R]
MRNRIIVIGIIAFLAFAIGSRVSRPEIKNRESVRHQLVRIWNDPKERKRRRKAAEKASKKVRKAIDKARG